MKSIAYHNTVKMLNFCKETFFEFSEYKTEEKSEMLQNCQLDTKDTIVTNINVPTKEAGPLPERVIVGTAYISEVFDMFMRYIMCLTRVNLLFSPLNLFCDHNGKNFEQAGNMIIKLQELADGKISDRDIAELAKYIDSAKTRKREFWVRLVCGIAMYLDLAIIIGIMVVKYF